MSFLKWLAAIVALALGAGLILGFPSLSPEVGAVLSASGVKTDRLAAPEPVKPEPVNLDTSKLISPKPGPSTLDPVKPGPAKPEQATPEPTTPKQAKPQKTKQKQQQQAKQQPAKPSEARAKPKQCEDTTWSHYEMKCQRTRTRTVNGVRTTRIIPSDPKPQE